MLEEQKAVEDLALTDGGNFIEIFRDEDGSWSLVATKPDGLTCIYEQGPWWESLVAMSGEPT